MGENIALLIGLAMGFMISSRIQILNSNAERKLAHIEANKIRVAYNRSEYMNLAKNS